MSAVLTALPEPRTAVPAFEAHERCLVEELDLLACAVVARGGRGRPVCALVPRPSARTSGVVTLHERANRALTARGLEPVRETHLAGAAAPEVLRRALREGSTSAFLAGFRALGEAARSQGPRS